MAESWKLTVRRGSKVTTARFGSLDDALDALERVVDGDESPRLGPRKVFHREIDPVAQVATRVELAGPQRFLAKVTGGVDVRGDGSPEPFVGRVNRRVVERRRGESAVAALRRELAADRGASSSR